MTLNAKWFSLLLVFLLKTNIAFSNDNQKYDLERMLLDSDRSRGGAIEGIVWDIDVSNIENDVETNDFSVHVKVKNHEKSVFALVNFLKPNKYRGQKYLLKNYSMWFAKPGLRRPVPISVRQRLSGNASNADIVAANYSNDYTATFLREDTLNEQPHVVVELIANKSLVSYYRIIYWIDSKSHLATKAEFFAKSGKPMKNAYFNYGNQILVNEITVPFVSEVRIVNHLDKTHVTVLKLSNAKTEPLSLNLFQANALLD